LETLSVSLDLHPYDSELQDTRTNTVRENYIINNLAPQVAPIIKNPNPCLNPMRERTLLINQITSDMASENKSCGKMSIFSYKISWKYKFEFVISNILHLL
jgi:hypothetical protein